MKKIVTIRRSSESEKIEVFIGEDNSVSTRPYNMVVEDAVEDMLFDIGEWDSVYLKEIISQDKTLSPNF